MPVSVIIATLNGIFIEKEVDMAILPAFDGEVGIMTSHVPFVFKMGNGLVKFYEKDKAIDEQIFIYGGFSQVHKDKIEIVTDKAVRLQDLDGKEAHDQIIALENKLISADKAGPSFDAIQEKLKLYRKVLEALKLN